MCASGGVCRFYLQGKCKFGDGCRNYHPQGRGGGGNNKYQPPPNDPGPSSRGGRNRFSLFSDWDDGDSKGGGSRDGHGGYKGGNQQGGHGHFQGRQDQYHYTSPSYRASQQGRTEGRWRGGGGGDSRSDGGRSDDRYSSGGGGWRGGRGDDTGGGGWRGGRSDDRYSSGGGGWRGGRGNDSGGGGWRGGRSDDRYSSGGGGWRGGRSDDRYSSGGGGWRGGRGEGSREYRSDTSSLHSGSSTSDDLVTIVQKDMEESLSMWPLTCYGHSHHIPFLPDLVDVSPEELRLEAYKAIKSGSPAEFVKSTEELVRQQIDLRMKYASLPSDDIRQLENFSSTTSGNRDDGLFGSLAASGSASGTAGSFAPSSLGLFDPVRTSASSLGFGVDSSSLGPFTSAGPPSGGSLFGGQQTVASAGPSLFGSSGPQSSAGLSQFGLAPQSSTTGQSLFGSSVPQSSAGQSQFGSLTPQTSAQASSASSTQLGASLLTPSGSGPSIPMAPGGNRAVNLTPKELQAFKTSFVLGKIPMHAPPPDLC